MDLGSFLLIMALTVVVGLIVVQPLMQYSRNQKMLADTKASSATEHERSVLLAERDSMLNALQELDFDFALGKISQEDYNDQRTKWTQSGAEILRKLDKLEPASATSEMSAEDRVEAAVAARRADAQKRDNMLAEKDELDAAINARRRNKEEKSAGFCPKCGNPVQKSDVFCSRCGATL
jgi:hypothetical protein